MVYRAVVISMLLGLLPGVMAAATGCQQAPKSGSRGSAVEERVSVAPGCLASGKYCFAMDVAFTAAQPTGRQDKVAKLSFEAGDQAGAAQPMELVDPKHPTGAKISFDACTIEMQPAVGEAAVVSYNTKQCRARTYYDFSVLAPDSTPIADFTIDGNGNLSIVTGSVKPAYDVQLISTHGRSVYLIFKVAEVTAKAVPLFAFEWTTGEGYEKYSVKAADGWSYEFLGNHGTLGFFHATCLGTLPDDLTLVAMAEQGDRTGELKAWAKTCKSSGG
jgi:hypothetical protein